jgi:hypothetical protein
MRASDVIARLGDAERAFQRVYCEQETEIASAVAVFWRGEIAQRWVKRSD